MLHHPIDSSKSLLLVMSSWQSPSVLKRLWCLYELILAVKFGATIAMVFTYDAEAELFDTLAADRDSVMTALTCNVALAETTVAADKAEIREHINEEFGRGADVKSICRKLGLTTEGPGQPGCLSPLHFLNGDATGVVDDARLVKWDHEAQHVTDVETGAILCSMSGNAAMDKFITKTLRYAVFKGVSSHAIRKMASIDRRSLQTVVRRHSFTMRHAPKDKVKCTRVAPVPEQTLTKPTFVTMKNRPSIVLSQTELSGPTYTDVTDAGSSCCSSSTLSLSTK